MATNWILQKAINIINNEFGGKIRIEQFYERMNGCGRIFERQLYRAGLIRYTSCCEIGATGKTTVRDLQR